MAVRNLQAEKQAVDEFVKQFNRTPENSEDWAQVHRTAYPTANDLPQEFQDDLKTGFWEGTGSTPAPAAPATNSADLTPDQMNDQNINDLQGQMATSGAARDAAGANVTQLAPALTHTFDALQKAIRTKMGYQQESIGGSDLFAAAGLTGFENLHQALLQKADDLKTHSDTLQNTLAEIGDQYKTSYSAAKTSWDEANSVYQDAAKRLDTSMQAMLDHERQMQTIKLQGQVDQSVEQYKLTHDPAIIAAAIAAGLKLDPTGQNWVSNTKGVISSPSGHSYDMSTYNAAGGDAYIIDLQNKITGVGKLQDDNALNVYLTTKMPNSGITVDDIKTVANDQNIGWEELLGLIQKESPGGASNVAQQNNNFGGITWSQSYQDSHPGVSKGSARPASEGGNYVKFATKKDGLEALGEQLSERSTGTSAELAGEKSYDQYGLLSNTDFNPNDTNDQRAKTYLDKYLSAGTIPSPIQIGISSRGASTVTIFQAAKTRAEQLFYAATGQNMPATADIANNWKLISANNTVLNKQEILADTIDRNFNLAIKGEITNDINKNATVVNGLLNPFYLALGDPAISQAWVSNGTISQEFANLISVRNASGTTVSDKDVANELIKFGTSVNAQKAVVERLQAEAKNIQGALIAQNAKLYKINDPLETLTDNPNRAAKVGGGGASTSGGDQSQPTQQWTSADDILKANGIKTQ